jgi:hypothetical protein
MIYAACISIFIITSEIFGWFVYKNWKIINIFLEKVADKICSLPIHRSIKQNRRQSLSILGQCGFA